MNDLPSYLFARRKPTLVLLFVFLSLASYAQWTYKATVHQSGSCIPIPLLSGVTYYTKSACEAARQQDINLGNQDWSNYAGNTPCTTTVTCTPCMGSDPGTANGTSTNGLQTPESVLIDGLIQGKAFYSPHQSREVEDWIEDYWQRMKSLGLPYEINSKLTPDDVPLTGDMKFDNLYANLMYQYSNTDGGTVDLRNKKGIVDPNDLKNPPTNTGNKQEGVQLPASGEVWYHPEPMINGGIPPLPQNIRNGGNEDSNDHPVIDLVREASVTAVSWMPGEAGYVGIVAVNIWAEDAKGIQDICDGKTPPSTSTMLVNAFSESAPDLANQVIGGVKDDLLEKTLKVASGSKGFAELATGLIGNTEKVKDLGGEITGGEGDGILGKISNAAWTPGHPSSGNNQ